MGERETRKEKKEREKYLCYWYTKAPCLGELSQRVLPWRIHHYRSPSNFEPLSPVVWEGTLEEQQRFLLGPEMES